MEIVDCSSGIAQILGSLDSRAAAVSAKIASLRGWPVVTPKTRKLGEPDARILALQIAATYPNHEATTEQIKESIPKYWELSQADLKPSATRSNECMWQQIVGNATGSHNKPDRRTSLFAQGLAIKTNDGIRVTDKGIALLKSKGLYE